MSYIAAMLLMNMQEEDAFWAFVVLLEKPKYLAGFYEHSLDTIQRHAKIFQQLLKHRMPCLWQHMENLEVAPLLFITTWFLTLFTSLPCWDSVLAIWDLIILD
ncbi:carabin-like, partial [Rhincodon typus]|uniref:carabin-like n=1 Tax=Rhincodon typus TaxID=259920 RepID=UPI00202EF762